MKEKVPYSVVILGSILSSVVQNDSGLRTVTTYRNGKVDKNDSRVTLLLYSKVGWTGLPQ